MSPAGRPGVSAVTAFFAFRAFPAIIIGGLDSMPGAVVGGFIVGMAEVFAGSLPGVERLVPRRRVLRRSCRAS